MGTVAFIRRCREAGMDWETALLAAEQFEATPQAFVPALTPRQARNRRYYEKRLKASETSETETPKTVSDAPKTVKTLSDAEPRARVRDISPRLVISGSDDAVVERERASTDDWPKGSGQHLVRLLVEAAESPWLDPAKSLDLTTTAGRIAAWRREGASWEHDVVPVVRAVCAKRRAPISSWKYFDAAVAQSIADNRAALTIPEAAVAARGQGPPVLLQMASELAEARRRALES